MHYLRNRGVKGYLALNVLIFPSELDAAARLLLRASRAGVDAVLIQDLGLAALATRLVPEITLHASSQMTIIRPVLWRNLSGGVYADLYFPASFRSKTLLA